MKGNFSKTDLLKIFKEYGLISIGGLMYSFAWTSILIPAGVMGGGLNGIGLLIYYATRGNRRRDSAGRDLSGAERRAGRGRIAADQPEVRSQDDLRDRLPSRSRWPSCSRPFPATCSDWPTTSCCRPFWAARWREPGISICFTQGGSTGGTDIIALIINKYKTVSYGKVLMLCDLIIIGCSLFIFKNITSVIYGYVMVAVFGYTIDAVMAGNRQSAQILIVSPKYDQIAERIFSEMHRGVTLLDGEGWYTKTPTKVVMVVCRKNETGILFRVIKEVDPHAFMTFGSVMGVYGLGFEALKK